MSTVATTRPSDAAPAPAPAHRPRLLRTAGLVALITLREILRRRGALALVIMNKKVTSSTKPKFIVKSRYKL